MSSPLPCRFPATVNALLSWCIKRPRLPLEDDHLEKHRYDFLRVRFVCAKMERVLFPESDPAPWADSESAVVAEEQNSNPDVPQSGAMLSLGTMPEVSANSNVQIA
jgi:hypothetical protein